MSHLTVEAIARLVDELPEPAEAAHLEGCPDCRAELEALKEQRAALSALPPLDPPAGIWPALEARLAEEGLLRPARPAARPWRAPALLRAAAALAIFVLGGLTGAALRGERGALPWSASGPGAAAGARDAHEAARMLREAEAAYLAALARYAELTGAAEVPDPVARLAALESIVLTTAAALDQAPADPVINGYHLAALAQRDALLRQAAQTAQEPWF